MNAVHTERHYKLAQNGMFRGCAGFPTPGSMRFTIALPWLHTLTLTSRQTTQSHRSRVGSLTLRDYWNWSFRTFSGRRAGHRDVERDRLARLMFVCDQYGSDNVITKVQTNSQHKKPLTSDAQNDPPETRLRPVERADALSKSRPTAQTKSPKKSMNRGTTGAP